MTGWEKKSDGSYRKGRAWVWRGAGGRWTVYFNGNYMTERDLLVDALADGDAFITMNEDVS